MVPESELEEVSELVVLVLFLLGSSCWLTQMLLLFVLSPGGLPHPRVLVLLLVVSLGS